MTKADIAQTMASDLGFTQLEAKAAVEAFLRIVTQALVDGERVELRGFGTCNSANRAPRMGRNPRSQQQVPIPARRSATFKATKTLRDPHRRAVDPIARPAYGYLAGHQPPGGHL